MARRRMLHPISIVSFVVLVYNISLFYTNNMKNKKSWNKIFQHLLYLCPELLGEKINKKNVCKHVLNLYTRIAKVLAQNEGYVFWESDYYVF